LNECGMSYIWNTQTFINFIWIVNTVKLSLRDHFKQNILNKFKPCHSMVVVFFVHL
jgi:hypothetical protein